MVDSIQPNGIVPFSKGGLGNQMFVMSAAYVVHKVKKIPLYLLQIDQSVNKHNTLDIDYNATIFQHFGEHIPLNDSNPFIMNYLLSKGFVFSHEHSPVGFDVWNPEDVSPGSMMTHYYQSYPALAPFENELRNLFLNNLASFREHVLVEVGDCANSVFFHIRRGDYCENSTNFYLQPIEYYEYCWNKLKEQNPSIQSVWIISDDIQWVKEQPFFSSLPNVKFYDNPNELETLALMSMCTEGAICANSTFSWWGAFLGAYKYRKPVYVPKKWIGKHTSDNLAPKEWNKISVEQYEQKSNNVNLTLREWQTYIKDPQSLIVQASTIEEPDGWQPYPIGMSWQYVQIPNNQKDVQIGPHDRAVFCAITDTTDIRRRGSQPVNRRKILHTLATNGIQNVKMDGRAYYFTLPQYKFVVSPEGNGIDCHRHYEAILAGCIPIIEDNPLMIEKYKGLPVLWTHDYSEITPAYLEAAWDAMLDKQYNFSALFLPNYPPEVQAKIKKEGNYWCMRVASQNFYT